MRKTKLVADGPAAGRVLALKACTGCHIVASDQSFKPVFTDPLARAPNVTAAKLERHLSSLSTVPRHSSMANPELTSEQLRDVTAFILRACIKIKFTIDT
jgi:mono/diheme cytochrome c family protein